MAPPPVPPRPITFHCLSSKLSVSQPADFYHLPISALTTNSWTASMMFLPPGGLLLHSSSA